MNATDVLMQSKQYRDLTFGQRRLLAIWDIASEVDKEAAMIALRPRSKYKRRQEEKNPSTKAEVINIQGGIKTMKSIDITDPLDLAMNKLGILAFAVHGMSACCYLDESMIEELTCVIYDVRGEIGEALVRFKTYEDERAEKSGNRQSVQLAEQGD